MRARARASTLSILYFLFFILYNDVWAGLREAFDKASRSLRQGFVKLLKPSGGLPSYPQGLSTGYPHEGGSMVSQDEAQKIREVYQLSGSIAETARQAGHHRSTINAVLTRDEVFANADYNARARMIRRFLR